MTEHKHVWTMIMRRDVLSAFTPTYCKPMNELSARQTEVLARHLLRIQRFDMHPVTIHHVHQPRSITWVALVNGTWLLAASSDATTSVLSLWSVKTVLASSAEKPAQTAAEVYLHGSVNSGKVFAQGEDVSIALDIRQSTCVDRAFLSNDVKPDCIQRLRSRGIQVAF